MDHRIINRIIFIFALCLFNLGNPAFAVENDIRVLIDTSGSMKQNDPKNLRIPALKLLINLLPQGSRAGVWLFDSQPQAIAPIAMVDSNWKAEALKASSKIHSQGEFTDIESALAQATIDWVMPKAANEHRNLILLTDGQVDISKVPGESEASRKRIYSELLPKLQQSGVQIQAISLSAQSDKELMNQLALSTSGWSETAQSPEQLQRAFIKIFNKAAPHEGLPLNDNQFTVDASIKEFTVLVLLGQHAKPTRLISPEKTEITQNKVPQNARWVHEAGYDLVTVSQPAPGAWKLEAESDPDNQVLVVTNLKMNVTPIDNHLTTEDKPDITASFTENGLPIEQESLLNLLSVRGVLIDAKGKKEFPMIRDMLHAGFFMFEQALNFSPGDYTFTVIADGKTFQRESTQTFHVMANWVKVEVLNNPSDPEKIIIKLTPDPSMLIPESLITQAILTDQNGRSQTLDPERDEATWLLSLPRPEADDRWMVNFSVTADTLEGQNVTVPIKPLLINSNTIPSLPKPAEEPKADIAIQLPPIDSKIALIVVIAVNLIVLIGGYIGYRLFKKRSQAVINKLINALR